MCPKNNLYGTYTGLKHDDDDDDDADDDVKTCLKHAWSRAYMLKPIPPLF